MPNFTETTPAQNGTVNYQYRADRKRGGASWVFFDVAPHDTAYAVTWPHDVEATTAFEGIPFTSRMEGDIICLCFDRPLTIAEKAELETTYTNHVAPV